jgi:membrane protease YdiL (CAAX protease family)
MSGIFLVEHRLGWVVIQDTYLSTTTGHGFVPSLLIAAAGFFAVGIYEELIFRGYLIQNLAEGFNLPRIGPRRAVLIAWILTSVLFGAGHALNPNATWISTLNISLAGVFLGLGYVLTRQLALPVGIHITWNFAQGNLYGFPVSGTTPPSAQVLVLEQGGPEAWTGGAFGPEAGLLGLLAILAGVAATWAWVRRRASRPAFQLQLAAPPAKRPERPSAPVPEADGRS